MSTRWFEQQEDELVKDLNEGRISREEFNKQMRELSRELTAQAEEAAQDAYDREMERW